MVNTSKHHMPALTQYYIVLKSKCLLLTKENTIVRLNIAIKCSSAILCTEATLSAETSFMYKLGAALLNLMLCISFYN